MARNYILHLDIKHVTLVTYGEKLHIIATRFNDLYVLIKYS